MYYCWLELPQIDRLITLCRPQPNGDIIRGRVHIFHKKSQVRLLSLRFQNPQVRVFKKKKYLQKIYAPNIGFALIHVKFRILEMSAQMCSSVRALSKNVLTIYVTCHLRTYDEKHIPICVSVQACWWMWQWLELCMCC